jgi:transcriptional regulator with GAF, ATPase, and Fis domain
MRLIQESPAFRRVVRKVEEMGRRGEPVLLLGETGTGKSLLAGVHHASGPGSERPFVVVSCPSLPPTLAEAELFGCVRGAFTHAMADRRGLVARADGGTLFLDELADLPREVQAKLLLVLESGRFRRLGASREETSRFALVSATNRRPERLLEDLREDLYFRLGEPVLVPPLRERPEDVRALARHFLEEEGGTGGRPPTFTPEAERLLVELPWPGNVRQLRRVVTSALREAGGGPITPAALRAAYDVWSRAGEKAEPDEMGDPERRFFDELLAVTGLTDEAVRRMWPDFWRRHGRLLRAEVDRAIREAVLRALAIDRGRRSRSVLEVEAAMAAAGGSVSRAAALLGVDRTTVHRVLQRSSRSVAFATPPSRTFE